MAIHPSNPKPPRRILITGGSGMIGTRLTEMLLDEGRNVALLSRNPKSAKRPGVEVFGWDVEKESIDNAAVRHIDAIIHLAGAGIADKRWTPKRRAELVNSRVKSADLLYRAVLESGNAPQCLVSANGVNYYGTQTRPRVHVESDPPSKDFIGQLCQKWEEAATQFESLCRVVTLRTGVVLAKGGGALPRIAKPVKWGVGAKLGSGRQYMPYIHLDDICRLYIHAMDHPEMRGHFNAVNGDHVTNAEFTRAVAKVLKKPLWLPGVPAFALKMALGEMGSIVLEGSRVSASKVQDAGFTFKYPDLLPAIRAVLERAGYHIDIAGDARHQLACLHAVEVGKGERLDMGKQGIAHVIGNPL